MLPVKGSGRPADLKITKSTPLFPNNHNFSDAELISTKENFVESLLNYLPVKSKDKMVGVLP